MCSKGISVLLVLTILTTLLASVTSVLNSADTNVFGDTADVLNWATHPCNRPCIDGDFPRKCFYVFVIEQFSTMSKACYNCPINGTDCFRPHCIPADGIQKTVYVVNRQMPGPLIEVCHNDIVVVEVRNEMHAASTTIHWHGMEQKDTPYMDGVPYVTQCPILPGQRFQYSFNASISGTYFWHSHIGTQRSDGLYGPLIVRPYPEKNRHLKLYDYDNNHMIVTDWNNMEAGHDIIKEMYDSGRGITPTTILINGFGKFKKFEENGTEWYTPTARYTVKKDKKYRFRVIDAGAENCPIEISIDNHKLLVISLDSNDIEPVEVDAVTIWPGERLDFVVYADQEPKNYWIRYRGYGQCRTNATTGIFQVAVLQYESVEFASPDSPIAYDIPKNTNSTRVLNPYNTGTEAPHSTNINIPLLTAMDPNDRALSPFVDTQIFITFDFNIVDNYDWHRRHLYGYKQVAPAHQLPSLQLNHISMKFPQFPLLSQWNMIEPHTICNATTTRMANCLEEHCACTHVIDVALGSVVELVFVDEGKFPAVVNHPLHLHGHFFRVIAVENLEGPVTISRIKQLDRDGKIKRRLDHAPLKDTIKAPGGGYTIVRFVADNPGYWLFHCHFETHMEMGMAAVFKVGQPDDFPPIPRNFPKCYSYTPNDLN